MDTGLPFSYDSTTDGGDGWKSGPNLYRDLDRGASLGVEVLGVDVSGAKSDRPMPESRLFSLTGVASGEESNVRSVLVPCLVSQIGYQENELIGIIGLGETV